MQRSGVRIPQAPQSDWRNLMGFRISGVLRLLMRISNSPKPQICLLFDTGEINPSEGYFRVQFFSPNRHPVSNKKATGKQHVGADMTPFDSTKCWIFLHHIGTDCKQLLISPSNGKKWRRPSPDSRFNFLPPEDSPEFHSLQGRQIAVAVRPVQSNLFE